MREVLLTCEHASNRVPARYRKLFAGKRAVLQSHRGWDPGAIRVARALARSLGAPLVSGNYTRLLVELNRTEDNRELFSEFTRRLPAAEKAALLELVHRPHWRAVRKFVRGHPGVMHFGVHTFAPVFEGRERSTAIGLLYDPARRAEDHFCRDLQRRLQRELGVPVHRNLPYRGTGNGLISALRNEGLHGYVGVELEVRNTLARDARFVEQLVPAITRAVRAF